jgi:hypothetical protein
MVSTSGFDGDDTDSPADASDPPDVKVRRPPLLWLTLPPSGEGDGPARGVCLQCGLEPSRGLDVLLAVL